jgi:hypothetical protein
MEAESTQMTDSAERSTPITRQHALCRVLDDQQPVPVGDCHDGVHIATHAGVMHRYNGTSARRDGGFDLLLIEVQRVRADIDEDWHRTAQHEGVGGRDERVGRHDHFVARLQVGKNGSHLERSGARVREQGLAGAASLLQPGLACPGEAAIASHLALGVRLRDVPEFFAAEMWLVERYHGVLNVDQAAAGTRNTQYL